MNNHLEIRTIEILLIEDCPRNAALTAKIFNKAETPNNLHIVENGAKALDFLYQEAQYTDVPRPDIIFLDLKEPGKDGCSFLAEIKSDPKYRIIPVIVFATSERQEDVFNCYQMDANCYLTKPVNLKEFIKIVKTVEDFWLKLVKLP